VNTASVEDALNVNALYPPYTSMESVMAKPKKKKVTREPHTQLFNEVLEGMAYAKLSPNEWQFIMVLWRLTYGRKNMAHKESGKFTTWINAEWCRRTGISKQNMNRIKNNLLRKKVIVKKKGMIGFNKHFKKWDKGSHYRLHSQDRLRSQNRLQVLPVQTTDVVNTDYSKAPKVKSSAEIESLKKERKKETIYEEDIFNKFWEKYPKKKQKQTAFKTFKKYHQSGEVSLEDILRLLEHYKKVDWADREMKYIPYASSWLNKQPWLDDDVTNVPLLTRYERSEIVRREWFKWQKGQISEKEFEKRKLAILAKYKEVIE
jgi:phage replication O-like protein O